MAVVVSSISESKVASAGRTQIEVLGSGFRQQTVSSNTSGPVPPPAPSVRVYFGGVEALRVRVVSATRLLVTTPARDPGIVDVRVENVDDFGAFLEAGTLAAAIEFALPNLTGEGDLVRIFRRLIRMLKQQVLPEVVLTSSIDWDDTPEATLRELAEAKTPAIWLTGPTLRPSSAVNVQVTPIVTQATGGASESRTPRTVDLVFGFGIVAESFIVTTNLVQAATSFAVRNRRFSLPRDPADASAGSIEFDLELEEDFGVDSSPNDDGLYSATATLTIKAVDLLGMPSFERDLVTDYHPEIVDEVEIESVQFRPE